MSPPRDDDRRRGLGRRIVRDRRRKGIPVRVERRSGEERRHLTRRSAVARPRP